MQHDLPDRRVHQPERRQASEREHVREQTQQRVEQADQHLEDRRGAAAGLGAQPQHERHDRDRDDREAGRRQPAAWVAIPSTVRTPPTSRARPGTPEADVSASSAPPSRKRLTIPIT